MDYFFTITFIIMMVWYFLIQPIIRISNNDNRKVLLPISKIIGQDLYDINPKTKLKIGIIMLILYILKIIVTGNIILKGV